MTDASNNKYPENLLTNVLRDKFVQEVTLKLEEEILPDIKKLIKEAAVNAVSKWDTTIRTQQDISQVTPTHQIQINF